MRPKSSGWLVGGQLAGSGHPVHHEELNWLQEQGIGAILSLTERSLRREKRLLHRLDPLGFAYRHMAVLDETAPSQAQVDEMLDQGKAVPGHCQSGYGRTGTIVACYLLGQDWGTEEAIAEMRSCRPGSIAPQVQQPCVVNYAERLGGGGRP